MKLSPRTFTPADWLKSKPYNHLSSYDTFYIQRCRELYDVLLEHEGWFGRANMNRDNLIELARMLGGYFEDFTNEIGIWSAFVRYNQSLYGYPLPFYDLTDYDTDYLNQPDLAFLVWKFMVNHFPDRNFAPDHPTIMEIADEAFIIMEDSIDKAPATDYYEKLFTVRADDNFFSLKEKLSWFGVSSYLLGTEMAPKLHKSLDEGAMMLGPENVSSVAYMLTEPYVFSARSSFSALNSAEWFAEVARCSPDVKEAIPKTQPGHMGRYLLVDDTDKTFYLFRHGQTDQLYRVRRDSLAGGKPLEASPGNKHLFTMNLRQWNGDWWLSGTLINSPATETQVREYHNTPVSEPWLYDDEKMALIRDIEAGQERAHMAFFGNRLVTFKDQKAYEAASKAFLEFSNNMNAKRDVVDLPDDHDARVQERLEQFKKTEDYDPFSDFSKSKDVSLFYCSGVGTSILANIQANAIDILGAENPTQLEQQRLFEFIAVSANPVVGRYLLDTYGTKNFRFPFTSSRVDALRDIEFFWRFYSPNEYDTPYPSVSVL
jgi:hypothetical protein